MPEELPSEHEEEQKPPEEGPRGKEEAPQAEGGDISYAMDEEFDVIRYVGLEKRGFVDGFGWKAIFGGLFVGLLIVPASMFMSLMIGGQLQQIAEWVTVIMFIYLARRIRITLSRQEMYVIFHVAGGVLMMAAGGYFFYNSFIWMQYLAQSPAAALFEISDQIPRWVAPAPGSEAYRLRSLLHRDWWPHLTVMGVFIVWNRLNFYSLGYTLFRITSDVERLPFPMAPVAAEGVTALAESDKESWRWTAFTVGSAIGIVFALIYVGIPTITQLFFGRGVYLIEVPFIDYTSNTEGILPAVPVMLPTHLGVFIWGLVVPFWAVIGMVIAGVLGQIVCNPLLYHFGVLRQWEPGMTALQTMVVNRLDFWLSFSIGTAVAIALIGIYQVTVRFRQDYRDRREGSRRRGALTPPKGRGDIPLGISIGLFVVSTAGTIMICHYLVPRFPVWILAVFGFVYTPFVSYISARMVGFTGHRIGFPYLRESTFVLTGYKGVDIWWAPIPMGDAGPAAQHFRQIELTGTKFTSIFKAQLFEIPLALAVGLLFWSFIWKMGEIPSAEYPYAARFWPIRAVQDCVWRTATTSGNAFFLRAIKWDVIFAGTAFGVVGYTVLAFFGLPVILIYGIVSGMVANPFDAFPMLLAACIGRYYLSRKFGRQRWRRYSYVLSAGFGCGFGLGSLGPIALRLIAAAVSQLPF